MKLKRFFPLAVLSFLVIVSLSGCGLASINATSEGNSISKNKLMTVPLGTTQNTVLAKFGEPSKVSKMNVSGSKEDIWFYCWKRGSGGSFLFGLVNTEGANSKCATFVFNKGSLVSKGIGKGSNNSAMPAFKIQENKTITTKKGGGGL
jgi:outer membrane protein assembly factor BamE (lipoprotein component of BamABCDE complex)